MEVNSSPSVRVLLEYRCVLPSLTVQKSKHYPASWERCELCGANVRAKMRTHPCRRHWAHLSSEDCDPWSEGLTEWHLSWQIIVNNRFVEVPIGPHRANVVGNGGKIIELQHSPIRPEDIEAREAFYDDMIWLFDATSRFGGIQSGELFFFSFGSTRHVNVCTRPLFLDFADFVVQVDTLTDILDKYSGFGSIRSRDWFSVENYLSEHRSSGAIPWPVRRQRVSPEIRGLANDPGG